MPWPPPQRSERRTIAGVAGADQRSLDRQIWALAAPAVLTLASEPLYLLADTAIVARLGTEALGGLAVGSAVLLFATGMLVFLTFGTAATVARLIGAGRPGEAAHQSVQGLWLGAGLGVMIALVLWPVSPWILEQFGSNPEVLQEAHTYLYVSLWGLPAVTIAMAGTGALRGHLDTRTPLVVAVGTNTLNIAVTIVFVFAFDMGIGGAAAGTVVAKVIAAIAYSVFVVRLARPGTFSRRSTGGPRNTNASLRPDPSAISSLAVVGRDLFIRTVALRASLTITVALAARKGVAALAGYEVAFQIWAALAYVLDALEAAAHSLVAKALGAKDRLLARNTARRIIGWAIGAGVLLGAATALAAPLIAGVFTDDPDVVPILVASLVWVGALQPLNGVAFALDGILVGAGDQRYLAAAMLVSLAVVASGALVVARPSFGLWSLWALLGAFMASRVVVLGIRYRTDRWEHV